MRVCRSLILALVSSAVAIQVVRPQENPPHFGGTYPSLDARRQHLVDDWVSRFNEVTSQQLEPGPFYDDILAFSTKTTFEGVTNALMQSKLSDADGAPLGDALSLVERVDAVHGMVPGTRGDNQFRMYVQLTSSAVDKLNRSREFKREGDNTVFHKGYPQNFREQGGTPSIQVSVALDNRRADIDVDYRSSSFPAGLFNGHLTASNSDVRAGDNYDRHVNRWSGFQNWWRGFLGFSVGDKPTVPDKPGAFILPAVPRAGKKTIDLMVNDFLTAWLIEGNIVASMGYISDRAYACLAENGLASGDRGMVPFELMTVLKTAHDAIGPHASLQDLTIGVRLTLPALKVVRQDHHAQFVIYSVPDDIAESFECENRAAPTQAKPAERTYGNYFGAVFYLNGRRNTTLALLWAKDNGYWKIVSWKAGFEARAINAPDAPTAAPVTRIAADPSFAAAARDFLESWLIRKDYDAAFRYLSERSYACYDLTKSSEQPASTSTADAGQRIRGGIERVGQGIGTVGRLAQVLGPVDPINPTVRLMTHASERTFTLTSIPTALADAADCSVRAKGARFSGIAGSDYGEAFGLNFRFRSAGDDAPVLRTLWRKESGTWRITAYDVEVP